MADTLPISKIRTDGGTQPRATIDFTAVDDYMDAMEAGVKFPPVAVFYDGSDYWLADGFHRCKAASQAGLEDIACDIHQGTQQDAQWYSFAANKTNGLRRTNEDKQRAVKAALAHPAGVGKSDSAIAKHVGVSAPTVAAWREKIHPSIKSLKIGKRTVTRNGSTYQQDTTNIGRKPVEIREPEPEALHVGLSRPAPQSITRTAAAQPIPVIDKERIAVDLLRALFDLAEHGISAAELVASIPQENILALYQKIETAFEYVGFVFEAAGKRQKGVA